jgi:hypothetical protein
MRGSPQWLAGGDANALTKKAAGTRLCLGARAPRVHTYSDSGNKGIGLASLVSHNDVASNARVDHVPVNRLCVHWRRE